jgi:hypothetical protein
MKSKATFAVALALVCLGTLSANAQDPDDVDPIADLAGLVLADATNQGTLYTTPGEEVEVLEALEAVPAGPGRYVMELEGELVEFGVVLTPLPALYLPADGPGAKPKEGKVYRNSRCLLKVPGIGSPCYPYNFQWAKIQTQPIFRCKKGGTEKCVEKKKVAWTRFIYSDNVCTVLIALQSKKKLSCQ